MADSTLKPEDRTKLDGIVSQMVSNGESDDYIQGVVNDFKQKYAASQQEQGGFWSGLGEKFGGTASKLYENVTDPHLPTGEFLKSWKDESQGLLGSAKQAADEGRYGDAAAHGFNFLMNAVPGLGKAMDDAATELTRADEMYDQDPQAAHDAANRALGKLAGTVGPMAAAEEVPGLVKTAAKNATLASATVKGAAKAAKGQIRPLLSGVNPLEHPLKVLPDIYDAVAETIQGGKRAAADYRASQLVGKTGSPAWRNMPEAGSPIPAGAGSVPSPPASLPSGRVPGPAPQAPPMTPASRSPLWAGNPAPTAAGPEVATPIASQLPSGRVPGGMPPESAPTPTPSPRPAPAWSNIILNPKEVPDLTPIPGKLQSGRSPQGGQVAPITQKTIPAEHPPFAPTKPFSPSRAARQQAPAITPDDLGVHGGVENTPIPSAESRLAGNPKAMSIAQQLAKSILGGQQ